MTSLWQLTNGKKFAQLIFSGDGLIDCEVLKDGGEMTEEFVDTFIADFKTIRHQIEGNSGYAKHHQYHESSNIEEMSIKPNATFINLNRLQEIPEKFLELLNLKKLQKKCNQLHKQIRQSIKHEKSVDEDAESDIEAENTNERYEVFYDNLK